MLTGDTLPEYSALASYLLHTASGISLGGKPLKRLNKDGLFYSSATTKYYLLYEPNLEYLQSNKGILNEKRADRIRVAKKGKKAIVFAVGKYIGLRELTLAGIKYCQLPYELHCVGQNKS